MESAKEHYPGCGKNDQPTGVRFWDQGGVGWFNGLIIQKANYVGASNTRVG